MPYTKRALIRREGYPIGQPAPLYIRCECGAEVDVNGAELLTCAKCGVGYDSRGWIITRRHSVRVTYGNGDSVTTEINGTEEEIRDYYIGRTFNVGIGPDDNLQRAVAVEFID